MSCGCHITVVGDGFVELEPCRRERRRNPSQSISLRVYMSQRPWNDWHLGPAFADAGIKTPVVSRAAVVTR